MQDLVIFMSFSQTLRMQLAMVPGPALGIYCMYMFCVLHTIELHSGPAYIHVILCHGIAPLQCSLGNGYTHCIIWQAARAATAVAQGP